MCAGKRNKWLLCIVAFAMVVCTLLTMVQPIVAYAAENEISFDSTNVLDDLKSSTVNGQPLISRIIRLTRIRIYKLSIS